MKLDTLTLKELIKIEEELPAAIAAKKAAESEKVKAILMETVSKAGFTMADIFGDAKTRKSPVLPKYRNPKAPTQTWSGRGRAPLWMPKRKSEYGDVKI